MAKQVVGVTDLLLSAAFKEFLEYGFNDASLRRIAADANTSTKSIYIRFSDKNALFNAVVGDTARRFEELYVTHLSTFKENYSDVDYDQMFTKSKGYSNELVKFIYDHFDLFKIIICKSEGTQFESFVDQLADIETEETISYLRKHGINHVSDDLVHILSTSYISGFFEPVRHDMTQEEANCYLLKLRDFFEAGWLHFFNKENK